MFTFLLLIIIIAIFQQRNDMHIFKTSVLSLLVGMAATSASAATVPAPQFSLTRFNYSTPADVYAGSINSQGQIFGSGYSEGKNVWFSTSGTSLNVSDPLPGNMVIGSLNASGQGIAYSEANSGDRIYYYVENGAYTLLAVNGLPGHPGNISETGQVTLNTFDSAHNARAYVYSSAGGYQEIDAAGASIAAYDINSSGSVVGYSKGANGANTAYLYANGVITQLVSEHDSPSAATGINNAGQITGRQTSGRGINGTEAFIWSNGIRQTVPKLSDSIGIDGLGRVLGYNDFGTSAMLWDGNDTYDLNDLIGEDGWYFGQVGDINEAGQISAYGCRNSICEVVRLDPVSPVPEPATYAMLLAGMALLTCAARKRC